MSVKKVLKVTVCGGSAVGKSSIGCRLAGKEPYPDHVSTVGVDFFTQYFPMYSVKINIWDLAGNERFQGITYAYVNGSDILIYVYDMSRRGSVRELRNIHSAYQQRKIPKIKSIVVGNKSDIGNRCMNSGINFAIQLNAPHIVVSAKDNKGLDQLLDTIMSLSGVQPYTQLEPEPEQIAVECINCDKCVIV